MNGKVLSALFVLVLIFLFSIANHQPQITPVYARAPACDLCGFCAGGPTPADYENCLPCLYENTTPPPSNPKAEYSWTVVGCISTTPGGFTQSGLKFIASIAGGIAFIALLYGSFLVLTSAGDIIKLTKGKTLVRSAILAVVIIIFSVFILRFIGSDVLKLPGFGEGP